MKRATIAAMAAGLSGFAGGLLVETGGEAAAEATAASKPAYMVVTGTVTDRAAFASGYAAKLPPLYERFGGRYLAIGAGPETLEGEGGFSSFVIAQWPSMEAARAFWTSPEYAALRKARIEGGWGTFDVFLVEGLAEPTGVAPLARQAPAPE